MTSIFDLPTTASELKSANRGIDRLYYEEVSSDRNATGNSFANGTIRFPFNCGATERWIPSKSYFRIRMDVTNAAGARLLLNDDVALNMNPAACLWSQQEVKLQNTTISRCADYVAQIDTLEKRKDKSRAWIEHVGSSAEMLDARQLRRVNFTAADGAETSENPLETTTAINATALGFDILTPNQVAFTAATGTLTFTANAGGAIPNITRLFPKGSIIRFAADIGGLLAGDYKVVANVDATSCRVVGGIGADVAAQDITNDLQRVDAGKADRQVSSLELTYQPLSLSLWKCQKALPLGRYTVDMTPSQDATWKKRVIESLLADKVSGTDYTVNISDIRLYVAKVQTARIDNLTYMIDLESTRAMADTVGTIGISQNVFDVSPSTYAVSIAYQDNRADTNTLLSTTKFKFAPDAAPTGSGEELKLQRFYFTLGGVKYPQIDADAQFSEPQQNAEFLTLNGAPASVDNFTKLYLDTQMNSGGYADVGGCETFKEWKNRGPYYCYITPRSGTSVDTRLTVNQAFYPIVAGANTNVDAANVLVFDHSRQVVQVQIKQGRVVDVSEYVV